MQTILIYDAYKVGSDLPNVAIMNHIQTGDIFNSFVNIQLLFKYISKLIKLET